MLRNQRGHLRSRVPHEQVAVVGGVHFRQRHPLSVVRNVRREIAVLVFEEHRAVVRFRVIAVNVEELGIALVRLDVEGAAVAVPADERRLELVAGRQIPEIPGGAAHVQVIELVPRLIVGDEEAIVVGKERHRVG